MELGSLPQPKVNDVLGFVDEIDHALWHPLMFITASKPLNEAVEGVVLTESTVAVGVHVVMKLGEGVDLVGKDAGGKVLLDLGHHLGSKVLGLHGHSPRAMAWMSFMGRLSKAVTHMEATS